MVKLLSYIYPITKKVSSVFNGTLELTWYNGKKYLNSKNANYSYGSLQKILKIGLQKINLASCQNILILGLGGGSVVKTLREDFKYPHKITAIDIDPVVLKIADEEFGVREGKNLTIICADAYAYISQNQELFDLIILDLFIDTSVPHCFYEIFFWQKIINAVQSKGTILFNASLNSLTQQTLIPVLDYLAKNNFDIDKMEKVNDSNTLVIAYALN